MLTRSTQELLAAHRRDIRCLFAAPLSARVGRNVRAIQDEGLEAGDFRVDEAVELTFADGSTLAFRHAFVVRDLDQGLAGVFSEHCGYFVFGLIDLEIRELRGSEAARAI